MGMKYRRACVTGGAGFIGSRLAAALLAEGCDVVIIDNLSTGQRHNVPGGADFIVSDILNTSKTEEAIRGCDIVFHLAARVAIRSSFDFVVEDTTANVAGTAAVLRAAQRSNSVRRVIFTSSMAVYSDAPSPAPVAETHPTRPLSPYGISKLAGEDLTHCLCAASGMESAVVRLFNTYGAGQLFSPYVGVVTIFVNKLLRGEIPTIFGDGMQARDFVHVEDIVSGFLCAAGSEVSGETFNIGTGVATTVDDVYEIVASALGVSTAPEHAPAASGELRYSVAGIEKARSMLGYQPKHELRTSIGEVIAEIVRSARATGMSTPA